MISAYLDESHFNESLVAVFKPKLTAKAKFVYEGQIVSFCKVWLKHYVEQTEIDLNVVCNSGVVYNGSGGVATFIELNIKKVEEALLDQLSIKVIEEMKKTKLFSQDELILLEKEMFFSSLVPRCSSLGIHSYPLIRNFQIIFDRYLELFHVQD